MHNYLPLLGYALLDAGRDPVVWIVMGFGVLAGWRRAGMLAAVSGAIALAAICIGIASTRYGSSTTWIVLAGVAGLQLWAVAFFVGSACRVMCPEVE